MKTLQTAHKLVGASILTVTLATSTYLSAGEKCKCSVEDISRQMSYLAKQLLEVTEQDSYHISRPGHKEPYIGICHQVSEAGIRLTCITPGWHPEHLGMQTGDIITQINGIDLVKPELAETKRLFKGILDTMLAGDRLLIQYIQNGETKSAELIVGEISYPAFEVSVER